MSDLPHDREQRLAALDPARSFIVRAPAGSGKTGLLIQRYLALLAHVDEPEEVVAITFTLKAADEMRTRVVAALELDEPADGDYERRTYTLANAVRERDQRRAWQLGSHPGRLRILTIDALCLSLVRQMVWVSGAGGDIRPAEDASELYRRTARNLFAQLTEPDSRWSDVVQSVLELLDNNVPRFETLLVSMLGHRDQWSRHLLGLDTTGEGRAGLEEALRHVVESELQALCALLKPDLLRTMEQVIVGLGLAEEMGVLERGDPEDLPLWRSLAQVFLTRSGGVRKRFTQRDGFPDDDELKEDARSVCEILHGEQSLVAAIHGLRGLPDPQLTDDQWVRLEVLINLLRLAVAELWVVFADRGEVDFIELAYRAMIALGEPERPSDLALSLDYRIRHLLVDEFQDTSTTQIDLLERLTAGWSPGDGRTLMLVGDPMQSIYRFREADVGLYLQVRDHGIGPLQLEPVVLQANFRSRPALVEWINQSFARLLPDEDDIVAGAAAYSACSAERTAKPGTDVRVHCLFDDDLADEAELVTKIVRHALVEAPDQSIAILVRARSHLGAILNRLREARVPFRGVNLDPLQAMPIVADLLALTRALACGADRIAWLSVLRAPWCGLTLQDLSVVGGQPGERLLIDVLSEPETLSLLTTDGRARVARVEPVLRSALVSRGRCTWRRLIEECWLELGGAALADEQALLDAETFLRLVEGMDSSVEGVDLPWLERQINEQYASTEPGDARLEIMTLHNAKGLEFDRVIVPGLERGPPPRRKKVIEWSARNRSGGGQELIVAPIPRDGDDAEPIYGYLRDLEKRRIRNEATRLLYVASTRAREHLHLIGCVRRSDAGVAKPGEDSLLARLWPVAQALFVAAARTKQSSAGVQMEQTDIDLPARGTIRRLPAGWCASHHATYLVGTNEVPAETVVEFDWAGVSARHVGTVVHQVLCMMSNQSASQWNVNDLQAAKGAWRALLAGLGVPSAELDAAVTRVHRTLAEVLDDSRGQWLLYGDHAQARSEMPLSGVIDGRQVNAILDRTFVDNQGVRWIIDYKTGFHAGGALKAFLDREQERYQPQLERYARLMRGLETRRTRLGLYFPLHRGWREWRPE